MSYRTYNIILKSENDIEEVKQYFSEHFKFYNVREFFAPFHGIICQSSETFKSIAFEKFPGEVFKNQDEVETYFGENSEERLKALSERFDGKDIAFIDVDCFGGRCTSEGYVIKNGKKSVELDSHHSAHQSLLKHLHADSNSWFFYPFTRTYFTDAGGINGDIANFSFGAIWMAINMDFGNDPAYSFQANGNELLLDCKGKFNIYLMKISDDWIKVMGSILVNEPETFQKVKEILEDIFLGIPHNIEIDNFESGENVTISNIDQEKNQQLKQTTYRASAFNEQTINLSDETQKTAKHQEPEKKKGFFSKLFGN